MSNFKYSAKDISGQIKEGVVAAESADEATMILREQGLIPVEIRQVPSKKIGTKRHFKGRRVKAAELSSFCWQLATMIEGGIPLVSAIETIAEDSENKNFQTVLTHLMDSMQKGSTLHASMKRFPKVFDNLFCSLVMAGESGGALPETLNRLGSYYDSRDKLVRRVKTAMAYPILVLMFVVFLVVFIMVFIIPRFKVIFDTIGGELPLFTRIFMGVYDAIANNIIFAMMFFVLVMVGLILYSKTKRGAITVSKIVLKIPLIGKVKKQAFIAMFCKTFATLLAAGVTVLDALDILSNMSGNTVIKDAMFYTRESIVRGSGISKSMTASGFFPKVLIQMTKVGEESGALPNVLDQTYSYYERRVESTITTVMSILEPTLILTVGSIVLIVVLALYLPIFNISEVRQ